MTDAGRQTAIYNSRWPWSPTGVARHGSSLVVLEHLRMPFVLLGDFGLGPYIRVRHVTATGTESRVVVWGRYSWMAGVITLVLVGVIVRSIVRRRRTVRADA